MIANKLLDEFLEIHVFKLILPVNYRFVPFTTKHIFKNLSNPLSFEETISRLLSREKEDNKYSYHRMFGQ